MSSEPVECLTYTVAEAAKIAGLGQTLAYKMIANGELPALRCGRRLVVPKAALHRWMAACELMVNDGAA